LFAQLRTQGRAFGTGRAHHCPGDGGDSSWIVAGSPGPPELLVHLPRRGRLGGKKKEKKRGRTRRGSKGVPGGAPAGGALPPKRFAYRGLLPLYRSWPGTFYVPAPTTGDFCLLDRQGAGPGNKRACQNDKQVLLRGLNCADGSGSKQEGPRALRTGPEALSPVRPSTTLSGTWSSSRSTGRWFVSRFTGAGFFFVFFVFFFAAVLAARLGVANRRVVYGAFGGVRPGHPERPSVPGRLEPSNRGPSVLCCSGGVQADNDSAIVGGSTLAPPSTRIKSKDRERAVYVIPRPGDRGGRGTPRLQRRPSSSLGASAMVGLTAAGARSWRPSCARINLSPKRCPPRRSGCRGFGAGTGSVHG